MSVQDQGRTLDAGGHYPLFSLGDHEEPCDCGDAVLVEPAFRDDGVGPITEVTLSLRAAELRPDGDKLDLHGTRGSVTLRLQSGEILKRDAVAQGLLEEFPWIAGALAADLDHLRERAARIVRQRDRSLPLRVIHEAQREGAMVPYDELFPADWDIIVRHDGESYWLNDHHCVNPSCPCTEVMLEVMPLSAEVVEAVGDVRLNLSKRGFAPEPSNALAGRVFQALSAEAKATIERHYREVRQGVLRLAAEQRPRAVGRVGRNDPCPCGSGKKYKRCCAGRGAVQSRS